MNKRIALTLTAATFAVPATTAVVAAVDVAAAPVTATAEAHAEAWWYVRGFCTPTGCATYRVSVSGDLDSRRCYVTTHRHGQKFPANYPLGSDTVTWTQGPDFICQGVASTPTNTTALAAGYATQGTRLR